MERASGGWCEKGAYDKTKRSKTLDSPVEMNRHIRTAIVAPMSSATKDYPTRVHCRFKRKAGQIVLDQIRTIDKQRLIQRLGSIDAKTQLEVIAALQQLFAF